MDQFVNSNMFIFAHMSTGLENCANGEADVGSITTTQRYLSSAKTKNVIGKQVRNILCANHVLWKQRKMKMLLSFVGAVRADEHSNLVKVNIIALIRSKN